MFFSPNEFDYLYVLGITTIKYEVNKPGNR